MVIMVKKEIYAITFLFTTLVFLIGIMVGAEITKMHVESIQRDLQLDLLEAQSLEVELSILQLLGGKEDTCEYIESRLPAIIKKKVELGRKFDTTDIPKDELQFLDSQFTISLGRYFIFNELQERECNLQKPIILFFKDDSETSRQQSRVLDNIVFSVSDVNITVLTFAETLKKDQALVRLIYNLNNVTKTPALIIKGVKYEGFQPLEKLTGILCSTFNNNYTKSICSA